MTPEDKSIARQVVQSQCLCKLATDTVWSLYGDPD